MPLEAQGDEPIDRAGWRGRIRLLLRVGAAAVVVVGIGWWAIQGLIGSQRFTRLIFRSPEHLLVEWSDLSMWIPGRVEVTDLRMRGRDRHQHWYAEAEGARLRISLLDLLGRRFSADDVEVRGVRFLLRRRWPQGTTPPAQELLPPIPGLDPEPAGPPRSGPRRPPGWLVSLDHLDVRDIEEIWIDSYRLRGAGTLGGQLSIQVRGPLQSRDLRLVLESGSLSVGDDVVAQEIRLDTTQTVDLGDVRELRTAAALSAISGRLALDAQTRGIGFLRRHLLPTSGLDMQASGALSIDVAIADGALSPGSRVEVDGQEVDVSLGGFRITGDGRVVGEVVAAPGGARRQLEVSLGEVLAFEPGAREPSFRGRDAHLLASSEGNGLTAELGDVEISARLPALEALDLARFDALLPPGSPIHIDGGSARLDAEISGTTERVDGRLQLVAPDLRVEGDVPFEGGVELIARIAGALDDPGLQIAGARLVFFDPEAGPGTDRSEWAEIGVSDGRLDLSEDWRGSAAAFVEGGSARLDGKVRRLARLRPLLPHAAWLDLEGEVDLEADLAWRGLEPSPGSSVSIETSRLRASVGAWTGDGRALLEAWLDERGDVPSSRLRLELEKAGVSRSDATLFEVEALALEASLPTTAEGLQGLEVSGSFRDGRMTDLTALNTYLPTGGTLKLTSGQATVAGRFAGGSASAQTRVQIEGRDVGVDFHGIELQTDLALQVASRMADFAKRRVDLAGTRLELSSARSTGTLTDASGAPLTDDWRATVSFPRAEMTLGDGPRLEAEVDLELSDSGPLLEILALEHPAAQRFAPFLLIRDSKGTAVVASSPGTLHIRDARFETEHLLLAADLRFDSPPSGGPRQRELSVDGRLRRPLELDAADLRPYLPETSLFELLAGRAVVDGHVALRPSGGDAELSISGESVMARFVEEELTTDLAVDAVLRSDPQQQQFDVSGTSVRLDDTQWLGDHRGAAQPSWWGQLDVVRGTVEVGQPLEVDARVALRIRDTHPLVHLAAGRSRVVRWFRRFLEIQDVQGSADIFSGEDGIRIEDLLFEGRRLEIRGWLDYGGDDDKALFFVRLHGLAVAASIEGGRHRFRLFGARNWFQRHLGRLFPQTSPRESPS